MQHKGRLTGPVERARASARGRTPSSCSAITRTHGEWKRDPDKIHITPGSVAITSGVWPDPVTSIEPTYWGVGKRPVRVPGDLPPARRAEAPDRSPGSRSCSSTRARCSASTTPRHWSERTVDHALLADDRHLDRALLARRAAAQPAHRHASVCAHPDRSRTSSTGWQRRWTAARAALPFEVINRNASAHFVGGIPIGDSSESGAVDPYLRMFGQPGLHVMDGSVMPANPGVNPSLTITALAERAMSLWPNKGDADTRPPLGLRLRARRPGHAAPSRRARRRSRRAAPRREEGRRHPRLPVLSQTERRSR